MDEHGIQDRENSRMYTKKPKCISGNGNFVTASIVDTRPTIIVLVSGSVAAIVVLLVEIGFKRYAHRFKALGNAETEIS